MQLHIPTMFAVIVATTLVLALSVAVVTRQEDHGGLRPFIGALGLRTAWPTCCSRYAGGSRRAFHLARQHRRGSVGHALMLQAIADFQQRRLARWQQFAPIIVIACSFALLHANLLGRVAVASAVFLFQAGLLLHSLITRSRAHRRSRSVSGDFRRGHQHRRHGRALHHPLRRRGGDAGIEHRRRRAVAVGTVFFGFIAINLVAVGFVLMLKEHADEKNKLMAVTDPLTGCLESVCAFRSARGWRWRGDGDKAIINGAKACEASGKMGRKAQKP